MTPPKSDFRKYLDQTGSLPADVTLGWIVVFQINEHAYDRSVMEATFDELGMPGHLLPPPNNPLHAWQKATSSVNNTDYDLTHGQTAHVLVRDAADDKEFVSRQLTREIRDGRRGRLGYSKVGEAVFYRPTTTAGKVQYGTERYRITIEHGALAPQERPALQAVVDKIQVELNRHLNYMDNMKYRGVVRNYLTFLNGLKIKDGFYFVHSNRGGELDKLRTLVERMGGGSTLFTLPLVDLGAQRTMVIEAYQAEAEKSLAEVVTQIATLRANRQSITPAAYAKIKKQYETAVQRSKEYARTLKVRQTTTAASEELAAEQLVQLQLDMLNADGAVRPELQSA